MSEQITMDDILSDKPVERPAPQAPVAPAEPAAAQEPAPHQPSGSLRKEHQKREFEAQGRDPETGKFLPKDEPKSEAKAEAPKEEPKAAEPAKPAAPVQEEMTAKEKAAFAKAADETRKRQALEARLRELEAKIQQPAAQPQGTPAEAPKTFWDDPEGALQRTQQQMQQAILGTRLQTAEAIARSRYTDFDEKVMEFKDLAMTTPGLAQQMLAAPDPAEFVYRTAANHMAIKQAGGVDALVAKAREEERAKVRQEVEAELKAKAEALAKERAALPGSLSDAPSKGSQRTVWSGPPSMADILTGK